MKKQNATNVVVGVIALVQTLSAQYVSVSPVPGNETVIQHIYVDNTVKAPPRNDLWDGVDKAIRNVKMMYGSVNLQSVMNELENMAKRNEIRLPYSYEVRWSASVNGNGGTYHHKKKKLNSENRQRKAEFERQVAQRIAKLNKSGNQYSKDLLSDTPKPSQFKNRDEFIKAYAEYKMQTASDEIRIMYSKKINGMSQYRMDMKREAFRIWNAANGKR